MSIETVPMLTEEIKKTPVLITKETRAVYNRTHYLKNKAKRGELNASYRSKHIDSIRATNVTRYATDPVYREKAKERSRLQKARVREAKALLKLAVEVPH